MSVSKLGLISVVFSRCVLAQVVPLPNAVPYQPDYWIGLGGSYSKYSAPPTAAGWVTAAVRVSDKTYSITTIDMMSNSSSLRTGVSRVLKQTGNWTVSLHADGGITRPIGVDNGVVAVGSFSGGGLLMYDLVGVSKKLEHVYIVGVVRIVSVTSSDVKPVFEIGIGRSF